MPWTTLKTFVAGAVLPASDLNTHLRDNSNVLRGGGIAISSQAALDFLYATSTTQLGRLAAVAGKFPRLNLAGTAWEMVYPGAGVHALWLPIAAFRPHVVSGCGGLEDVLLSSGRYISGCPFDPSSVETASMKIRMPESWNEGTVTFLPAWFQTAGGSGGVAWQLAGLATSDGDTQDAAPGSFQASVDTALTAKFQAIGPASSAITIAGTPVAGDTVRLVVQRDIANGGDTYGSDAYLEGLVLFLTTDKDLDT